MGGQDKMGKRLSKIVTRTGDDGTTGLTGGGRIPKNAARMQAIGTVDELNAFVGLFIAYLDGHEDLQKIFLRIQHDLFDLGGELSMPGYTMIKAEHWEKLEEHISHLNETLAPLENFILPGGSKLLAYCHIVRTVSRRAERYIVALGAEEDVNADARIYLNRLSDLAFVTARYLAHAHGETEILWQPAAVTKKENG
jgi:cob(I)alamin adenosyltransferase|tara:strand:- start:933 stop:1520 length:588 start_codon:yes stop_codon:yes gene_type:complete